jgi:hypothetical protein
MITTLTMTDLSLLKSRKIFFKSSWQVQLSQSKWMGHNRTGKSNSAMEQTSKRIHIIENWWVDKIEYFQSIICNITFRKYWIQIFKKEGIKSGFDLFRRWYLKTHTNLN